MNATEQIRLEKRKPSIGFLITLLAIALIVLFLISLMRNPPWFSTGFPSPGTMAARDLDFVDASLIRYKIKNRAHPIQEQGLDALVSKPVIGPVPPEWQPLVKPASLIDTWGQPYRYLVPGKVNPDSYDLWSAGKDLLDGTSDDLYAK